MNNIVMKNHHFKQGFSGYELSKVKIKEFTNVWDDIT